MFCRLTCHLWYIDTIHRFTPIIPILVLCLLKVQMPMQLCLPRTPKKGGQENDVSRFLVSSFLPFASTGYRFVWGRGRHVWFRWLGGVVSNFFNFWAVKKLGNIYIYSDIWFLWLWQWHVKSWLGSKIAHDMSKNKSVAWRVGSFTKFDRRNHNRLLQRRLPPSQNKVNLRDFRKWLIKNMFFLWFYTPPETNMESENHPSEKELHLPNLQRFHVCFPGCRESS